jgi:8-oxo-dGTP diphosphatase
MPVSEQGVTLDRYMLIPRVLIFIRRDGKFLLIKGATTKRIWAGKYNGVGGHVEPGEDVLSAARRELLEETGFTADLWLCGTVVVDTGRNPGICMYVFAGESPQGKLRESTEGSLEWIPFEKINDLPIVEDLPVLLNHIQEMKRGDMPFSAHSQYIDDKLIMVFAKN